MHVIIIGAGIGGVSAAIALRHVGHTVTLHERAPEPREVGIGLGANALSALRQINAHEAVYALSDPITTVELSTHDGRTLSAISIDAISRNLTDRNNGDSAAWASGESPFACALRNSLMSLTPRRVMVRQQLKIIAHVESLDAVRA